MLTSLHDFMHEGQAQGDMSPPVRQRIRLPFEKRPGDPGEWSYDHRAGICITLIVYLCLAIAFMWWKLDFGASDSDAMILIDFPEETVQRPEQEPELLDHPFPEDFSNVRNLASNDQAELNSQLSDAKGIDANQLYESANALEDRLRANREAYEEGLRQQQELDRNLRQGSGDGGEPSSTRVEGRVTVSYSFTDPIRHDVVLVVPAYRCEGGGQVVVNVTLDINGNVTSASVERSQSSPDECMQSTALGAARSSRFNVDPSAPSRHRGTISYIFIPQ